jgi:hypothetical protein
MTKFEDHLNEALCRKQASHKRKVIRQKRYDRASFDPLI